jgi:hypothetical protein
MGRFSERRALYYEDDENFDPVLSLDVNEYLIDNYVAMSLKQRQAIWHLCQTDEEFDYSSLEDQIDEWVIKHSENDPTLNIDKKEISEEESEMDEDEEEEEEYEEPVVEGLASVNIEDCLNRLFEDVPADDLEDLVYVIQSHICYDDIYEQIETIANQFFDGDYDEFLDEDNDEPESEEPESEEPESDDE